MVPNNKIPNSLFFTYFNQTFNPDEINGDKMNKVEGTQLRTDLKNIENIKSFAGSGSNYLSNEIFYRVAK